MLNIIGYVLIVLLTFGGFFAACSAGVYVGIKQSDNIEE